MKTSFSQTIYRSCLWVGSWCLTIVLTSGLMAQDNQPLPGDPAGPAENPLANGQTQLATRFKKLESLLLRSAEVEATTNPARAELMQKAATLAKQVQLSEAMVRAARSLEQKQYSQAIEDQKASLENLNKILELLQSENRADRVREQRDQIRRTIEETNRLLRLESSLRGRTEGGSDMERAAGDQQKLAEKAAQIAQDIAPESKEGKDAKDGKDKNGDSKDSGDKQSDDKNSDSQQPGSKKDGGDDKKSGDKSGDSKSGDKKSDDKKPGDDKPRDKKSDDKKSGDKQSGDKDSGDKKSDDKKSDDKKSDDKSGEKSSDGKGKNEESGDAKPGEKSDNKQSSESQKSSPGQPSPSKPSPSSPGQPGDQQSPDGSQQPSEEQEGSEQPQPKSPEGRAAKSLQQAQKKMQEAQQNLKDANRQGAVEKQRQAEQELKTAIEELEEILRQLREEEIERSLTALEERLRLMLQLQNKVLDESKRLQEIGAGGNDRQVEIRANNLASDENKIVGEAQRALLLLREEGTSAAFPESLSHIISDMQKVAERLRKADVGKLTIGIEEDIVSSLEELVAAMSEIKKENKERKENQMQAPGQQPQGQPGEQPLVNQLAEMRLIKTLQLRINKRTQTLAEVLKDPSDAVGQTEAADIQAQLRELAERQSSIKQVTRDIVIGKNKQ